MYSWHFQNRANISYWVWFWPPIVFIFSNGWGKKNQKKNRISWHIKVLWQSDFMVHKRSSSLKPHLSSHLWLLRVIMAELNTVVVMETNMTAKPKIFILWSMLRPALEQRSEGTLGVVLCVPLSSANFLHDRQLGLVLLLTWVPCRSSWHHHPPLLIIGWFLQDVSNFQANVWYWFLFFFLKWQSYTLHWDSLILNAQ